MELLLEQHVEVLDALILPWLAERIERGQPLPPAAHALAALTPRLHQFVPPPEPPGAKS